MHWWRIKETEEGTRKEKREEMEKKNYWWIGFYSIEAIFWVWVNLDKQFIENIIFNCK